MKQRAEAFERLSLLRAPEESKADRQSKPWREVLILFVAGNSMAQSVRERINELGVLKTLGFGDGRILALVLLESCTIAFLGGGLGLLLIWSFIKAVGDPTGGLLPIFNFPPRDVVIGAALVVLLGVGTGFLPAMQASRLKIVDALRRG